MVLASDHKVHQGTSRSFKKIFQVGSVYLDAQIRSMIYKGIVWGGSSHLSFGIREEVSLASFKMFLAKNGLKFARISKHPTDNHPKKLCGCLKLIFILISDVSFYL